ncbi:hypothetical protein HPB47_011319, partial [Ixodes persulcatus]
MAALTALGVKSDTYGAMLCSVLLRMLPEKFVLDYHKCRRLTDKENGGIKTESLQRFLKLEVESREEAQQVRQREAKSYFLLSFFFDQVSPLLPQSRVCYIMIKRLLLVRCLGIKVTTYDDIMPGECMRNVGYPAVIVIIVQ